VSGTLVAQKSVTKGTAAKKMIYWHRELPPFDAGEADGKNPRSLQRIPPIP
jgi:hypothetical protein